MLIFTTRQIIHLGFSRKRDEGVSVRILLSNYDMNYLGGTQVWIHEMWHELRKHHDVSLYTPKGNSLWPEIAPFDPEASYDAALINHWPTFRDLRRADIGVRVFTSHGVGPRVEFPPLGADAYVSVSRAVQRQIPYPSRIVGNPIDTERYRSSRPPNPTLQRVAFVSNRQGRARPAVEAACRQLGVELRIVGDRTKTRDVVSVYNWADLVIGVARTALEALSCERNVICFDWVGGAGLVTESSVDEMSLSNFGGHLDPSESDWYSPEELARLMCQYDSGRSLRWYVLERHHPSVVVDEYLRTAQEAASRRNAMLRTVNKGIRRGPKQLTSIQITRSLISIRRGISRTRVPSAESSR